MDFFGIGAPEILLVLLLAFIVFGPGRIVEISRKAGRVMRNLSNDASDIQRQLENELGKDKHGEQVAGDKPPHSD